MRTQAQPPSSFPQNPCESVETVVSASRSNFLLSFLSLTKKQREAMRHFYALSRVIDDAVDEHDAAEGEALLEFWRQEIGRCYRRQASHPIGLEMQKTIEAFDIPKNYLDLLLEGCAMDLHKKRYKNFSELYEYCYRVAGVIGLVCMKIFGLDRPEAAQSAVNLGLALQLTNILRDIKADAALGRLYLPEDELARFEVTAEELLAGETKPALVPLLRFQGQRARSYFDQAFAELSRLPRRKVTAAWIMGKTYEEILKTIERRGYDVFSEKIALPTVTKLRILLYETLKALFSKD